MSTVVEDCKMAKILLKKFGYLEKRVTYLEGKSRCQEVLIQKLKVKLKLKMRNRRQGQVGQSDQVDCDTEEPTVGDSSQEQEQEEFGDTTVDVKPNLIELTTESIQNGQQLDNTDILKHDIKLSQKLVVNMGIRCSEKVQEFANSSCETSIERDVRSKLSQNQQSKTKISHKNVKTRGKSSSKPKGQGPKEVKKAQICAFCSKSFISFAKLSDHMRVHTGERPFKCTICSKSFKQMSNLRTHTRIHSGEKPYSCSVCSETFTHTSGLKYHLSKHFGTYSCSTCSKKFGSKFNLRIHKRRHTGEKDHLNAQNARKNSFD